MKLPLLCVAARFTFAISTAALAASEPTVYPDLYDLWESPLGFAMLKLALSEVGEEERLVVSSEPPMVEGRAIAQLENGDVSVVDTVYSAASAARFDVVPIPIDRGLLGRRVFISSFGGSSWLRVRSAGLVEWACDRRP